MAPPLTGLEASGQWTTLEQEQSFLEEVSRETAMSLSVAGTSVGGKSIWRCDLGSGTSTLMIVCLQHGTEPASREGALAWIRDLAYSTESATQAYLENHKLVLVPNVNPDRLASGRNNMNNVNLNRDWWRLTQPESLAVQSVIHDASPAIIVDAHETSSKIADWMPYPAGLPGTFPAIQQVADEGYSRGMAVLAGEGYSSALYPISSLPWGGLSTTASASHATGFLSETTLNIASQDRVSIQKLMFDMLIGWHSDNRIAIDAAHADSISYALHTADPVPYPTREYIGTSNVSTADVVGYNLQSTLPEHLIEAHGIEVVGSYVAVNQQARLAVAALCDPSSTEKVVEASRVPRAPAPVPEPELDPVPTGAWIDTFAHTPLGLRRVKKAWFHGTDDIKRRIMLP